MENVDRAADSLKTEIQGIPIARTLGARDQAVLAFALWQMRGAAERAFLADWYYTALPFADSLEYFLRDVEKEARPDTRALLVAIVGDRRFGQAGWSSLARILEMVNPTLSSPLVETRTIYEYQPNSKRPDQDETLAAWRTLLRQHFGLMP
jgi:hypothetical protein